MLKGFTHARLACGCRIAFREGVEGSPVTVVVNHEDGAIDEIQTTHTMSDEHIEWFRAGSALNVLRQEAS